MRIPLATNIQSRDGSLAKDAKLVNAFVDEQGATSFVVKRPGLTRRVATDAGTGLGMVSWEGNLYSASGADISQTEYATIPSGPYVPAQWQIADFGQFNRSTFNNNNAVFLGGDGSMLYINSFNNDGSGKHSFFRSSDGQNWQLMSQIADTATFKAGQLLFCNGALYLLPFAGSSRTHRSIDGGASWVDVGQGFSPGSYALASSGTRMYAKPNFFGNARSSTDGVTWTDHGIAPDILTTFGFKSMACYQGKIYCLFVAITNYPGLGLVSSDLAIAVSSDFTNWTYHKLGASGNWVSPSLAADSENLFLLASNGVVGASARIDVSTIDTTAFTISEVLTNRSGFARSTYPQQAVLNGALILLNEIPFPAPGNWPYIYLHKVGLSAPQGQVSPAHSYAFTTVTPGLPLSWVGTSPGASTKRLFIKNTEKAWTLTLGTPGTLTQVTDSDYPEVTVPGAVYLDGYFFVMDEDGTIYNCDLENATSWNALNFITAEAEWDKGVAIAKHQNYVVALKDWTTELFYDAANPTGSPLAKVSNAAVQIGCAQGYSVVQFHGGLIFMSKTREKGRSIHFFPAGSIEPQEIATPAIQRILNVADLTTVSAWGGKILGRVLYVLNLVSADLTLVYDFTTQKWSQWTSDTAGTEGHFLCGFYATDGRRDFLLHEATGDVFSFDATTYQDDGADIPVLIRTGRIDAGNMDRKTMRALTVVGDQSATSVSVQYSDDDYQTFSSARTVSMNDSPARLTRLGMFRRRSFDIRHVDNTPLRLMAIDADMEQAR